MNTFLFESGIVFGVAVQLAANFEDGGRNPVHHDGLKYVPGELHSWLSRLATFSSAVGPATPRGG